MYRADMSAASWSQAVPDDLAHAYVDINEPVMTSVEVADQLGVTQQAAHSKLQRAHEAGVVEKKKVGARAVVWWIPDLIVDTVSD